MKRTMYDDRCTIHNTDNDRTEEVEVLDFSPRKRLVVSVQRSIKLTLVYQERHGDYVGSMAGMEFTSRGPKEYTVGEDYAR